ncbi:MAG: hypothetical protein P1V97_34345, partial [Planctomycetota bacterium]|nr:hypothetical protein [Planctomycetota bacterium]
MNDMAKKQSSEPVINSPWSKRWLLALILCLLMIWPTWNSRPRVRAQFYKTVFLLGPKDKRSWCLRKLGAEDLSEESDIIAECCLVSLKGPDPSLKTKAYYRLLLLKPHPKLDIEAFIPLMTHSDSEIRQIATVVVS